MAIGDSITAITNDAANGSTTNYQPAASVEWLVTGWGIAGADNGNLVITDGTNTAVVQIVTSNAITEPRSVRVFATNSIYVGVANNAGAARDVSITGVQTK